MQKMKKVVRLSLFYGAALLLVGSYPLSVMAEAADSSLAPSTATAPESTQPAPAEVKVAPVTTPTPEPSTPAPAAIAPAAPTSVPTPAPVLEKPAQPKETYTYNAATGRWDSNKWQYNPTTGKYERTPAPVQVTPLISEPAHSPVVVTPNGTSATDKATNQPATTVVNDTTKNAIANAINAGALTGNAAVLNNTQGGNATSGNALSAATIINNVNSTVGNTTNQKAATFVSDIMGNVSGDILLQPMLLKAMLEAGAQTPATNSSTITTTNQLTNTVNLGAQSGNATVADNTKAGSATTGSADTVANVLNIVNSMVAANQSFVGTINIYGSLDGDILIAPDFIPQMLANNGTTSKTAAAPAKVSSEDTQSIVNNVALAAQTGKAVVADNTTAGSATTGDANTNVVLFNLTGHDIVASNSLLVFVNVLGKWVGVIVDAPTGATAAAIGNGVTTNQVTAPDLVISAATNSQITNNITLSSQSGDALVKDNTFAGNATTGNATASANIGNIIGTQMGLSGWFGVLFINVFGTWNGSFGVDTAAGNHLAAAGMGSVSGHQDSNQPMRVIEFIPHNGSASFRHQNQALTIIGSNGTGSYTAAHLHNGQPQAKVASASRPAETEATQPDVLSPAILSEPFQIPWLGSAIFLAGLSLVGVNKLSDIRKRARG